MNVDSRDSSNPCQVKSKYFTDRGGMDDSLSDFEEKKNFKNTQKPVKPSTSKAKPKKGLKKIRGQKDIRTAIKGKNSELVAYSNEFDKLCKESGIDIDPEQLQLAIALSKSLQHTENQEEEIQNIQPLSTQERAGKIRTTLLEYGFVVPEIKITAKKTKRGKRYRKDYKLLLTTEEEKQQIISDKYSKVLFNNFECNKVVESNKCKSNSLSRLYHTATYVSYEEIRDNTLFYTEDLIEKLPNSIGTLLRDWSEIPGRPVSPVPELKKLEFEKIRCTQEELDCILSGSLKTAQEIAINKYNLLPQSAREIFNAREKKIKDILSKMNVECIDIADTEEPNTKCVDCIKVSTDVNHIAVDLIRVDDSNHLKATQNIRSCSPDLFDDDFSSIVDDSAKNIEPISQELQVHSATKICSVVMDLTECINVNSQKIVKPDSNKLSQDSQRNNMTKRRSNDLMDITDCVVSSSKSIRENIIEERNIDLTQNSDDEGESNVKIDIKTPEEKPVESMDLTQTSESSELPAVHLGGKDSLDNTIILNEDLYTDLDNDEPGCKEIFFNIKQNSERKGVSLSPITHFSPKNNSVHYGLSITKKSEDEVDNNQNMESNFNIRPIEKLVIHEQNLESAHTICGSKESIPKSPTVSVSTSKTKTDSFFEEFVHQHSESSSKEHSDILCVHESLSDVPVENDRNKNENIDLTQNTDSSGASVLNSDQAENPKKLLDTNNLGKIGQVSIDYDEIFDDMVRSHTTSASQSKSISLRSSTAAFNYENIDKHSNSDLVSNSSQNSEVFEISDEELDYSLHKSRLDVNTRENFDFGGISVVDNLPDLPSFRPSNSPNENINLKKSSCQRYLPSIDVEIRDDAKAKSPLKSMPLTPSKVKMNGILAQTPKNGEYVIKTDEVTPMLDYEAMSTPEVTAELEKYGLKPFKRKRAIQLLTHLYNQTHPIVASCSKSEDLSSPSKKRKPNTSPTKRISPKKISDMFKLTNKDKSPKKTVQREKEDVGTENFPQGNIYEVTNEMPDIRAIECADEDLVFQKKEKAKVHGCRVPLHIAFHNYVYSRPRLREAILRYEPVNIDVVHKGLVANGFRYDPKDLLRFMDKKCITVKTVDGTAKNKKHY